MPNKYLSAYSPMDRDTPEARSRAAQMSYDDSRTTYEDEVNRARMARDQAQGNADRSRGDAERSIGDYAKGGATPLTSWKPTAMTAYAPTQMAQWMSSAGAGRALPARAAGGTAAAGGGAWQPGASAPATVRGAVDDFESENLKGFDASALENFDPAAAGKTFAGGAYGDFKRQLSNELRDLTNRSVGAGRFNTGLFDEDQGGVVTELGGMYEDKIAQQAGVFSGQRLDALRGGTDMRFKRASEMDTNARSVYEQRQEHARRAAEQEAELDYNRGRDTMQFGLDRDKLDLEGYGLETDRYRIGGEFAQAGDELSYKRASDMDRLTYDQARDLTDVGEKRALTGLNTATERERTYLDESYRRSGDATEAASGQRDWAARDRELEELRAEIEAMRREKMGIGADGSRSGTLAADPYAAQRKAADARGYTFRG